MEEKILELIRESGEYNEELKWYEYSNSWIYYVEDPWSGTEVSYSIENNHLVKCINNDSPEQAGGWVHKEVWCNGKWWNVSNIADRYTWLIHKEKVYLLSLDRLIGEDNYRLTLCSEHEHESYYEQRYAYKEGIALNNLMDSELREFCKRGISEGSIPKHYFKAQPPL